MSVESMAIALHHSRATGTARLVLLGIANHDGDGGAWPAVATLAKYAGGLHRVNVQRALAKLVQLGEIDIAVQQGGTQDTPDAMRPNRYTFLLRCPGDCDHTSQHKTGRQLRLDRGPGRPPVNRAALAQPGSAGAAGGAALAQRGGAALAQPEPSKEPPIETGAVGLPNHRGPAACGQPASHSCDSGWLGEQPDGRRAPCLLCKPHLRAKPGRAR